MSHITQKKHPRWSRLSIKLQALGTSALLKRDCKAPSPETCETYKNTLKNTSDGSFWHNAKYDLSLKVRGQFQYSRAKTGGITLKK